MSRVNAWAFAEPRVLDDNVDPVSGGGAYIYEAGTTTQIALTSDKAGTTAITQPVTADASGRLPDVYMIGQAFKVVYVDSAAAELQTIDNIEVSSGVLVYDTYALLTAATGVPSTTAFFKTLGYYARGDGGDAEYVRVASEPSHGFKTTVNAGAVHVEGLPKDGVISTKATGAACDVTGDFNATSSGAFTSENTVINAATDDTAAIQAAVDFALHYGGNSTSAQPVKVLHAGKSRITDTIHLGYGVTAGSVAFEGVHAPLRGEDSMAGSSIVCTFSDRPMINIQGARGTTIKNLFLRGGLDYTGVTATVTGTTPTVESNWDAVMAVNRYAPFALITIDAYCGTQPGTAYPDVTFPSWMGAQAQYGKLVTSRATIENVIGRNAQVFGCQKPSDDNGNVDFIRWVNCFAEYCKHFISVGNGQGRNMEVLDCEAARVFDAFVNGIHGQQAGQFGGPIKNFSVGSFCNRIFHFTDSSTIGTSTSFENLFAEGLHRWGDLDAATSGDTPLAFKDCRTNWRWDDTNGVPANAGNFANCTSTIRFENCSFTGFPDVVKFEGVLNAIVDGVEMADAEPSSATRLVHNATTGGLVFGADPKYVPDLRSVTFSQRALAAGTETRVVADERLETTGRDYCVPLYLRKACHSGASTARYEIQSERQFYRNQIAKSTCWSSASRSGKTITATWSSETLADIFHRGGYIGDLWIDVNTGTTGYVATAVQDGADIDLTFVLLNNYVSDGGGGFDLVDTSFSLTSGNVAFLNCRVWATRMPLFGRTTSGSATLETRSGSSTAVATTLGDISTAGSINDMLWSAARTPNVFTSSTSSTVSSISSPDITMGGTAAETWGAGSNYSVPLHYWVRDEV